MNEARKSPSSPSSPGDPEPLNAAGSPIKNRLVTGLLLAFCCWHGGFLVYSIFPAPPPTPGKEVSRHLGLDFYQLTVSGWQEWTLFDTIPTFHSMDIRLVGEDGMGNEITLGCVLPEFKPYPKPELSRYYTGFYRLLSFKPYREAYLQNLAKFLPAQQGFKDGKNWSLVVDVNWTRNLHLIRKDGHVTLSGADAFPLPSPGAASPR